MNSHKKTTQIARALVLASIILLAIRLFWWYYISDAPSIYRTPFLFLAWNLCLAWIPWWISRKIKDSSTWLFWPGALVWLLFLPNAPYLLTDLIHLQLRAPIPLWFDATVFFLFAVTGWVLGAFSLVQMEDNLQKRLSLSSARALLIFAITLSGFGVYIGRFRRWNSWDALLRPNEVLHDLAISLLQAPILWEATLFSGIIAALMGLSYWVSTKQG